MIVREVIIIGAVTLIGPVAIALTRYTHTPGEKRILHYLLACSVLSKSLVERTSSGFDMNDINPLRKHSTGA